MKTLLIALAVFALPLLSRGQLIYFQATLSGAQEVPVRDTPAFGFATATLDPNTNFFQLNYTFSGLLAPQTAAHIHRGAPGVSGPIVIGAPSFQLGSPALFFGPLTDALETDLISGLLYLNIHSTMFPAGEIRGQLIAVPEPASYALAGGALLLGVVAWRQRRSRRLAVIS